MLLASKLVLHMSTQKLFLDFYSKKYSLHQISLHLTYLCIHTESRPKQDIVMIPNHLSFLYTKYLCQTKPLYWGCCFGYLSDFKRSRSGDILSQRKTFFPCQALCYSIITSLMQVGMLHHFKERKK